MDIFSVAKINFKNCKFTSNNSTAISAVGSNIMLTGNLTFENNTAVNGGAIKFCDTSIMFIKNNTHISFVGNQAKFFLVVLFTRSSVAWKLHLLASSNRLYLISPILQNLKLYG